MNHCQISPFALDQWKKGWLNLEWKIKKYLQDNGSSTKSPDEYESIPSLICINGADLNDVVSDKKENYLLPKRICITGDSVVSSL